MADVFISHHMNSAGHLADELAAELYKLGVSSWHSRKNTLGTQYFQSVILKEIRKCKVFVLLLNAGYVHSPHIIPEIEEAMGITPFDTNTVQSNHFDENNVQSNNKIEHPEKVLILFWMNYSPMSDGVRYYSHNFQRVDGFPPYDKDIKDLAQGIAELLHISPPTAEETLEEPMPVLEESREAVIAEDIPKQLVDEQETTLSEKKRELEETISQLEAHAQNVKRELMSILRQLQTKRKQLEILRREKAQQDEKN